MVNFRKIRALLRLREAQSDLKDEILAEKAAQQVLKKLNRGDFRTYTSGILLLTTYFKGYPSLERVQQLLQTQGVTAKGERRCVWGDVRCEHWTITLPEED